MKEKQQQNKKQILSWEKPNLILVATNASYHPQEDGPRVTIPQAIIDYRTWKNEILQGSYILTQYLP